MKNSGFLKQTKDYFIGYFMLIDDSAPNSAFIDAANDGLVGVKEVLNMRVPKCMDPYDIVMYYLENKNA